MYVKLYIFRIEMIQKINFWHQNSWENLEKILRKWQKNHFFGQRKKKEEEEEEKRWTAYKTQCLGGVFSFFKLRP